MVKSSAQVPEGHIPDMMSYDDIYVKSNDLSHVAGPTLIAMVHNEMYFLPAWLEHYRKLGVERFILLDDASTDATLDYLKSLPDVMVVGSKHRYGDTVVVADRSTLNAQDGQTRKFGHLWRMMMTEKYALDTWAVHADADEFLVLPKGRCLGDLFEEFASADFDAVTGTMLDTYPADIGTLRDQMTHTSVNLSDDWYFDARPHRLPKAGRFRKVYAGSRSRLFHDFLPRPALHPAPWLKYHIRRLWHGRGPYRYANETEKFPLIRWRPGTWMQSSHKVSLRISSSHHLPILHMKFTGDLYRRAHIAIRDQSYYRGSADYVRLVELIAEMESRNASFLCPWSAPIHDPEAFMKGQLFFGFRGSPEGE